MFYYEPRPFEDGTGKPPEGRGAEHPGSTVWSRRAQFMSATSVSRGSRPQLLSVQHLLSRPEERQPERPAPLPPLRLTRRGRIVLIGIPLVLLAALLLSLAGFFNSLIATHAMLLRTSCSSTTSPRARSSPGSSCSFPPAELPWPAAESGPADAAPWNQPGAHAEGEQEAVTFSGVRHGH